MAYFLPVTVASMQGSSNRSNTVGTGTVGQRFSYVGVAYSMDQCTVGGATTHCAGLNTPGVLLVTTRAAQAGALQESVSECY